MLALDKIFTTLSSTTFVHMCRHNQHKIKVSQRGFKSTFTSRVLVVAKVSFMCALNQINESYNMTSHLVECYSFTPFNH